MKDNGTEDLEMFPEDLESDIFSIMGYLAQELSPHTTPEGLVENCARATGVSPHFVRELLVDCRREFFSKLVVKTQAP